MYIALKMFKQIFKTAIHPLSDLHIFHFTYLLNNWTYLFIYLFAFIYSFITKIVQKCTMESRYKEEKQENYETR